MWLESKAELFPSPVLANHTQTDCRERSPKWAVSQSWGWGRGGWASVSRTARMQELLPRCSPSSQSHLYLELRHRLTFELSCDV